MILISCFLALLLALNLWFLLAPRYGLELALNMVSEMFLCSRIKTRCSKWWQKRTKKVSALPVATAMAPMAPSEGKKLNGTTTTTTTGGAPDVQDAPPTSVPAKKTPNDFIFGKVIGEGSFSTVYLAKDIHTSKEYAIKVCDKRQLIRERKTEQVKREKDVLNILTHASFYTSRPGSNLFLKLSSTFQDLDRLYFVLTYAKNGELLPYINKVGSFDVECTRFYSGEILVALEHLHRLNIIHRDLKPENILLDEHMHILIGDFGSSKILGTPSGSPTSTPAFQTTNTATPTTDAPTPHNKHTPSQNGDAPGGRRYSFVGTAQYVSPELLTEKTASPASDLWALGCIVYQMISGLPPFRSRSEYIIFQKILKLDYEFPPGFSPAARDLVTRLLALDPAHRLGAHDLASSCRYHSIREHPFYRGIDFDTLTTRTPPTIYPYLPGTHEAEDLRSVYKVPDHLEPGLNDRQLTRLLGLDLQTASPTPSPLSRVPQTTPTPALSSNSNRAPSPPALSSTNSISTLGSSNSSPPSTRTNSSANGSPPATLATNSRPRRRTNIADLSETEKAEMLREQRASNRFSSLVSHNLILKQGSVDKRKGLFSRRRTLLLTSGPHLYYVDPASMTLKGEIPFSPALRVEPKNFKIFFVHTPSRTYYLEDPEGYALEWCKAIEETRLFTYGDQSSTEATNGEGEALPPT